MIDVIGTKAGAHQFLEKVGFLVAAFGIMAVLVLEFGSFRSTLIVATVIPLGVTGALLALLVTGYTLSFTGLIGLLALLGIEIKNSILLVDFTNQLRAEGVGLDEAIEQAGAIRFFPILLTSATAIGGLMPLAIQGSLLYSPLAIVIIGGLLSSTLLVTTTPLWLAMAGRWLPGERPLPWQGWLGLLVALIGSGAMLLEGSRSTGTEAVTTTGAVQALLGALFAGLYWLAGRAGRQTDEVGDLSVVSTGVAALALGLVMVVQGHAFFEDASSQTWMLWVILAVFPQLIGHNGLLWALRHWSATTISVLVLLEPVFATAFAGAWGEAAPSPRAWAAAAVAVAGVAAVVWQQRQTEGAEAEPDAA
jgi:drug/metabolite transporter (DMT)-like permease